MADHRHVHTAGARPDGVPPGDPRPREPEGTAPPGAQGSQASQALPAPPKFGFYADDGEVFGWIRDGAPEGRTCLEAQVMDWADDVAYSVHDLEDGLHAGHITVSGLHDRSQRQAVAELTATNYCAPGSVTVAELSEVFDDLLAMPCWPAGFDGGPADLAGLKYLTSELIGRFCGAAQAATIAACGAAGPLIRYAADLVVPRRQRLECALLKGVAAHYVMSRPGAATAQARERELIAAYVSGLNGCQYCSSSHSASAAAQLPGGMTVVEQVRADPATAQLSAKLKTLLVIAAAVQRSGLDVTPEQIAEARTAGATDLEIHDAVLIAAACCMLNRYVDGLATIAPDDPAAYAAGAQRLITEGYLPPAVPSREG